MDFCSCALQSVFGVPGGGFHPVQHISFPPRGDERRRDETRRDGMVYTALVDEWKVGRLDGRLASSSTRSTLSTCLAFRYLPTYLDQHGLRGTRRDEKERLETSIYSGGYDYDYSDIASVRDDSNRLDSTRTLPRCRELSFK